MKKYKALILFNLVLTIAAVSVWGYVLYENNKDTKESSVTIETRDASTKKVNSTFGLKFDTESLSTTPSSLTEDSEEIDATLEAELEETLSANIVLDGSTKGIKEVTLVVSYDPLLISISDIVAGDLFDTYTAKEIDESAGIIKLTATMSEDKDLSEGDFASINFTRLKPGETNLIIFEDDLASLDFTTAIDFDGNKTTLKSSQVSLY